MSIQSAKRTHSPAPTGAASGPMEPKAKKAKYAASTDAVQPLPSLAAAPSGPLSPVPDAPKNSGKSATATRSSAASIASKTDSTSSTKSTTSATSTNSKPSVEPQLEPLASDVPEIKSFSYTHRDGTTFTVCITGNELGKLAESCDLEGLTKAIAERVDQLERVIPDKKFTRILFEIPGDSNKLAHAIVHTDDGENKRVSFGGGDRDPPPPPGKPSWKKPWRRTQYALYGPEQVPEAQKQNHKKAQHFDKALRSAFLPK